MLTIISRKQAKQQGLTQYFTGIPCKRGHISPRNVSSSNCLECWREDSKRVRDADPDRFKLKKQIEYMRNKKTILEAQKKYRAENWDTIYQKRKEDPQYREYMNAYFRSYFKNDKNRAKHLSRVRYRQALIVQQTPKWITREELQQIQQLYVQAARQTREQNIQFVVDHIIPLNGKEVCGLHCLSNLRIISWNENRKKWNKLDPSLL